MTLPSFTALIVRNDAEDIELSPDDLLKELEPGWEAVIVQRVETASLSGNEGKCNSHDSRFRIFHAPGLNRGQALNLGMTQSSGQWICFLADETRLRRSRLKLFTEWIDRCPEARFLVARSSAPATSSDDFEDDLSPGHSLQKEWQVLEMLRRDFIQDNPVCVHRESLALAGGISEQRHINQDYDMWLRLLGLFPGVEVEDPTPDGARNGSPRPSCSSGTDSDSCKAAIDFLNCHTFPELVPWTDLGDRDSALRALDKALDVAGYSESHLYFLGPHPALVLRVMEWACGLDSGRFKKAISKAVQAKIEDIAGKYQHSHTPFAFLWKALRAATDLPTGKFVYQPIDPHVLAETTCSLRNLPESRANEPLRSDSGVVDGAGLSTQPEALGTQPHRIVIVFQVGQTVTDTVKYGALRATIQIAKHMMRAGHMVLLTGLCQEDWQGFWMGYNEGVPFLAVPNGRALAATVRSLGPVEVLIGISRSDILCMSNARHYMVYQHNAAPIHGWMPMSALNREKVKAVVVSRYSRTQQIAYGLDAESIEVVRNGCDFSIFFSSTERGRMPHTLVHAAIIAYNKGFDIALRAFDIVRRRFPNARFFAYGLSYPWRSSEEHLLDADWLDSKGYPIWSAIEADVPGFHYLGSVSQTAVAEAFRRNSMLLAPSRITEPLPLVALEAQACGCIPIVPRQGGFPETVKDGITGYIYDDNKPEAIAENIDRLWEDGLPDENQREQAEHWVRESFSWERAGTAFLSIVDTLPACPTETSMAYRRFLRQKERIKNLPSYARRGFKEIPGLVREPGVFLHRALSALKRG